MDVMLSVLFLSTISAGLCLGKEVEIIKTHKTVNVILTSSASIWEPDPPYNDSYVLGQFAHNTGNPPSASTELYVARSVDGSLAPPLGFLKPLMVLDTVGVWPMVCPTGFVSLGAIATKGARHGNSVWGPPQPDKSKYRCVHRSATVVATPTNFLHRGDGRAIFGSANSSQGFQSPFFVIKNSNNDKAYAIKKDSVVTKTDLERRIQIIPTNTSGISSTAPTTSTPAQVVEISVSSMGVKVAVGVLVGSTLISLMVLACCIWHKKRIMKVAPSSTNTTTNTTTMNNESDYEMVRSVGSDLHLYGNPEAEVRENILYEQRKDEREIRANILYQGVDGGDCDYAFATEVTAYRIPEAQESPSYANYHNANIYATPTPV